jgi:hypothetical protein
MFPAGGEQGSSGGGVIPSVLVPTRFVWPHGGRRVFLVGSFTRLFFSFFIFSFGLFLLGLNI